MLLTPPGVSHFKGSQVKEINLLVEQFQANLELEKCLGQVNAKRQGGFEGPAILEGASSFQSPLPSALRLSLKLA